MALNNILSLVDIYFCYIYDSSFICGMPLKDVGDHGSLRLPVFVTRNNLTLSHPSLIIFCYVYGPYFICTMPLSVVRKHGSSLLPAFFIIWHFPISLYPITAIYILLLLYAVNPLSTWMILAIPDFLSFIALINIRLFIIHL